MPLSATEIYRHLEGEVDPAERFALAPCPDAGEIREKGAASIDLRLGTWFVTNKVRRHSLLDIYREKKAPADAASVAGKVGITPQAAHAVLNELQKDGHLALSEDPSTEQNITTKHYVPLGRDFILHPNAFVLAATLEWLRMPRKLCGFVTGKSSWGRRGLIIETAPGVHPGFVGCLTLEIANVGEMPIRLITGTKICQLYLHTMDGDVEEVDQSDFLGQRQPRLGKIRLDHFVKKLMST